MPKTGKIEKLLTDLPSISAKSKVMQQIGVNICNIPKDDEFKHIVACIKYFVKLHIGTNV